MKCSYLIVYSGQLCFTGSNGVFLEENQYALVKNNGLPRMIQALTESQDEELNKAATFVLQNCKKISKIVNILLYDFTFFWGRHVTWSPLVNKYHLQMTRKKTGSYSHSGCQYPTQFRITANHILLLYQWIWVYALLLFTCSFCISFWVYGKLKKNTGQ